MTVAFDHTDQHGDRITVTRPPAGGFTLPVSSTRYHVDVQVWLPAVEAVHLAAVLTREEDQAAAKVVCHGATESERTTSERIVR